MWWILAGLRVATFLFYLNPAILTSMKKLILSVVVSLFAAASLAAQTHNSVPLDDPIYTVIEQAQLKGLCPVLSEAKPYSQHKIQSIINTILSAETDLPWAALTAAERAILNQTLDSFRKEEGWSWLKGEAFHQHTTKSGIPMTFNAGVSWQSVFSGSAQAENGDLTGGTDNWGIVSLSGDMGPAFSWRFSAGGGLMRAPRDYLGKAYTFYKGFEDKDIDEARKDQNKIYDVMTEPLSFFPYTYRKNWDGSIFKGDSLGSSGFFDWPQGISFGYQLNGEAAVSFLDDAISVRAGRLIREWGAGTNGSSLVLNAAARPFFGVEANFEPFSWLRMATLTGVLEYYNAEGISISSATFQNLFSIGMAEANYKNFVHFSLGSSVVYPKRFELGYTFPLLSRFFYQNNVGDFDNLAMFATLIVQYPGIGKLWGSAYVDEMDLTSPEFFNQDRNMYALQAGAAATLPIPGLAFRNFTFQYTKLEPYVYTHQLVKTPWYEVWMEEPYMNNGVSLGYYLPPNSDELKVRFDSSLIGGGYSGSTPSIRWCVMVLNMVAEPWMVVALTPHWIQLAAMIRKANLNCGNISFMTELISGSISSKSVDPLICRDLTFLLASSWTLVWYTPTIPTLTASLILVNVMIFTVSILLNIPQKHDSSPRWDSSSTHKPQDRALSTRDGALSPVFCKTFCCNYFYFNLLTKIVLIIPFQVVW